jgi:hypothetical protein
VNLVESSKNFKNVALTVGKCGLFIFNGTVGGTDRRVQTPPPTTNRQRGWGAGGAAQKEGSLHHWLNRLLFVRKKLIMFFIFQLKEASFDLRVYSTVD